jgi:hypothetical protein
MKFAEAISEITKDIQFLSKVFSDFLNIGEGKGVRGIGRGSKAQAAKSVVGAALDPLSPFPAAEAAFGLFRQSRMGSNAPPPLNRWINPPVAAPQSAGPTARGGWPESGSRGQITQNNVYNISNKSDRRTAEEIRKSNEALFREAGWQGR